MWFQNPTTTTIQRNTDLNQDQVNRLTSIMSAFEEGSFTANHGNLSVRWYTLPDGMVKVEINNR